MRPIDLPFPEITPRRRWLPSMVWLVPLIAALIGLALANFLPSVFGAPAWIGWIVAMVALNAIPYIAMSVRHNAMLGVLALFADGFLSGIILSPILFYASLVAPAMITAALLITGVVFVAITAFIFLSGRTFNAPRGLMFGMFAAIMAAVLLNSFLHIGWLGVLVSAGIGIMGVVALVSSTSGVLNSPDADSPIPGALALFAGVFNIFVAVLNILLRLFAGGGRSDD